MYKKTGYRRRRGRAPRKYVRKPRVPTVKKLARQVKIMKNTIRRDVEVKEYTPTDQTSIVVGQLNVNNTGTAVSQLNICNIGAGVGKDGRVGVKTKLIGLHIRFQFIQQANNVVNNRIIVEVWKTRDFAASDAGIRDLIYDTDSISGVVDANSTKNSEFIKSKSNPTGLFELVGSRSLYCPEDSLANGNYFRDMKMFIKQRQQLFYAGSSTGVPQNYRYFIVMRAQAGNVGASDSTLVPVPIKTLSSGFVCRYQYTAYYTDE